MISGTRKEREPDPQPDPAATPSPATPAGMQTRVFDAGDGVKVAVTASPQAFVDDEAKWRALILKDVGAIRSRLGWILFFILAAGIISIVTGLFSGIR